MLKTIVILTRLARAGLVFARYGASLLPPDMPRPWPLRLAGMLALPLRLPMLFSKQSPGQRLAHALTALGPSYIKLGQFLATREDVVGKAMAADLACLQDRLPPFSMTEAKTRVTQALGQPVSSLYAEFGPAIAAASIAQVHKASVVLPAPGSDEDTHNARRAVAVKILRPGVRASFKRDLESYYFSTRLLERLIPQTRRLKPVAVIDTLARSVELEMDLRLEAAALSEMAELTRDEPKFRVPEVDWQRTATDVLTMEWIDGIPISDRAALAAAGHDLVALGNLVLQSFLRHAMFHGFFHADMHQGNLFVDDKGRLVAIDFGIVGRLGMKERRFLAEILHGFITRDYRRAAQVHFDAGYVPKHHKVETFAQALRAIGEPLQGKNAEEISMARFLGQLFQYTEVFDMETRPELIMLQKTMVVAEGVARSLNPQLNMWETAAPVVREWMTRQLGLEGRLAEAGETAGQFSRLITQLPVMFDKLEQLSDSLTRLANQTDAHSLQAGPSRTGRNNEFSRSGKPTGHACARYEWGIWAIALALSAIAIVLLQ